MGDMGFQNAGAAASLQDLLRQRIIDRINAEAVARHNMESDRNFGMQQQQMDFAHQQRTDALNETARQHDLTAAKQTEDNNRALNEQIPAGTFFEDAPAQKQIVGRLQSVGGATMEPNQQERPKVDVGPLLPGDDGGEKKRGYLKLASSKQQTVQEAADAKVEAARLAEENRQHDDHQKALDRSALQSAAIAGRPAVDKLTKVEHKDPTTGRTVIEYLPQSEVRGKTFDKGTSGTTENRLASAQAVTQTGDDIIAQLNDPKVAAALGPAMGRYNTMRDFIGNPPPELSDLAGRIESYALANMGVHGMRSAQGAEQIKSLLDRHHTPESLASTIRGLNGFSSHFMANEGRGGASAAPATATPATPNASGAPAAPAGWKYVPKAGGGWTAVKATP